MNTFDYRNRIFFTNLPDDISCNGLIDDMCLLQDYCALSDEEARIEKLQDKARTLAHTVATRLIDLCAADGFAGNLWQVYLTLLLVNHENAFTLSSELRKEPDARLRTPALYDLAAFHVMYAFSLEDIGKELEVPVLSSLQSFPASKEKPVRYSTTVRDAVMALSEALSKAKDAEAMADLLCDFYARYGVGNLGLHKAFRMEGGFERNEPVRIVPVRNIRHVSLDDLVGYDRAKEELLRNTEAFVEGRVANNCLLYGDAGTGKSTSIKAIANQFYDKGLRVIEVYKHQFRDIHDLISRIKTRAYRFILYMDDLSFEEFETEYKYLKAVIEGGLEKRPENVLIYATSNRRHLVKERFSDKASLDEDDIRHSDTVQEKLSLAHRFGVSIYFGPPSRKEYNRIVTELAHRKGINMEEEELIAQATQWEIAHGGLSGRCAQQFIDYLAGEE